MIDEAQQALATTVAVARALNLLIGDMAVTLKAALDLIAVNNTSEQQFRDDAELLLAAAADTQERVRRLLITVTEHSG